MMALPASASSSSLRTTGRGLECYLVALTERGGGILVASIAWAASETA